MATVAEGLGCCRWRACRCAGWLAGWDGSACSPASWWDAADVAFTCLCMYSGTEVVTTSSSL